MCPLCLETSTSTWLLSRKNKNPKHGIKLTPTCPANLSFHSLCLLSHPPLLLNRNLCFCPNPLWVIWSLSLSFFWAEILCVSPSQVWVRVSGFPGLPGMLESSPPLSASSNGSGPYMGDGRLLFLPPPPFILHPISTLSMSLLHCTDWVRSPSFVFPSCTYLSSNFTVISMIISSMSVSSLWGQFWDTEPIPVFFPILESCLDYNRGPMNSDHWLDAETLLKPLLHPILYCSSSCTILSPSSWQVPCWLGTVTYRLMFDKCSAGRKHWTGIYWI